MKRALSPSLSFPLHSLSHCANTGSNDTSRLVLSPLRLFSPVTKQVLSRLPSMRRASRTGFCTLAVAFCALHCVLRVSRVRRCRPKHRRRRRRRPSSLENDCSKCFPPVSFDPPHPLLYLFFFPLSLSCMLCDTTLSYLHYLIHLRLQ